MAERTRHSVPEETPLFVNPYNTSTASGSTSSITSGSITSSTTTTSELELPTQQPGVIFKDVIIKCADANHWHGWFQCMSDYADKQCTPMKDEPSKHMCRQLWEITFGMY